MRKALKNIFKDSKKSYLLYLIIQASERRLRPLQKECTLRELLMESIKKPPKPLRSSSSRQNVPRVEETSVCKSTHLI